MAPTPNSSRRGREIDPRTGVDKLQVTGYRMMGGRVEQALVTRDNRPLKSLFGKQKAAAYAGVGVVVLVALAGLVVGFINPNGRAGDAKILATKQGARYVVFEGRVHPVANLSSARLIAGSSANTKNVGDKDLAKFPMGLPMGIPSAPDEMPTRSDDPASWAVCSQYDVTSDLDLIERDDSTTLLVAGRDALLDTGKVPTGTAVLAASMAPGANGGEDTRKTWLLLDGYRREITESNSSLLAVLRLTSDDLEKNATPVSHDVITAIPARPSFTRPSLTRDGQKSSKVSDYDVGTVLTTEGVDGPERWLVLDGGLQQIGPFTAELLMSTGSDRLRGISRATVDKAPRKTEKSIEGWPWEKPKVQERRPSMCYRWTRAGKGPVNGAFYTGTGLSVTEKARTQPSWLLPARARTPQADAFYSTPGKGWLATATGSTTDSQVEGQMWWVAPNGVRYAIAGDEDNDVEKVLGMLGLADVTPTRVPWSTLALLPAGPTLSPNYARTAHTDSSIDKAQGRAPEGKDLN